MNDILSLHTLPKTLQVEIAADILTVKISRTEKRNALNDETILGIQKLFSNIPDAIKCAVIYGEGKHFSAGLDLSELKERDLVEGLFHSRMWHQSLDKVQFGK